MPKFLTNIVLALVSICATLGAAEFAARYFIADLPRSAFNLFAREFQLLGQTSKAGIVPREPYIAIVGDSYGVGKGDWFTNIRYDRNSRYQATHIIQDRLGIDVLSLSRSGSGNYDGLALFARNSVKVLRRFGFELPKPEALVVYFYEGNDISDNLRFMKRYYSPKYDESRLFENDYFAAFAEEMDRRFCNGYVKELEGNFLVIKGIGSAFESIKNRLRTEVNTQPYGAVKAKIQDKIVEMQNDVLDLEILDFSDEELSMGLRFFERALNIATDTWGSTRRVVIYIPSPISSYDTLSPEKDAQRLARSGEISTRVREAAELNGYEFFSAAPAIRAVAGERQIHGPWDWSHLNKDGYGVLADVIIESLGAGSAPGCQRRPDIARLSGGDRQVQGCKRGAFNNHLE